MTDDLIESVARAIAIADAKEGKFPILLESKGYMDGVRELARSAIRAAAPLILDMAALEAERHRYGDEASNDIRQLKERFQ